VNNLLAAIKSKFSGSALSETVGGRIYFDVADANEYPRVVYHIISSVPQRTFTSRLDDVLIQFDLFSAQSAGEAQIGQMYADIKALFDECELTITGSTFIWMYEENLVALSETLDEPLPDGSMGLYHWAVDYSIMKQ
jgi:hypothetical protein